MEATFQVSSFKLQVARLNSMTRNTCNLQPATCNLARAFTLIELLVVISILGILAALSVPALKSLGKSNVATSASRQMLDDIGHARQMAIGQHTTVYMIFVKTNFWMAPGYPNPWSGKLSPTQLSVVTNLCEKQLTGYAFISLRSVGDQPGQGQTHYLSAWQKLPDGNFIAAQKFLIPGPSVWFYISAFNPTLKITPFNTIKGIAYPTEDSPTKAAGVLSIPYIAFNYLGQLTVDGQTISQNDEYIPLAQGSVGYALDTVTKTPILSAATLVKSTDVTETPPGNSTNTTYNIIHIDRLTGRATMEYRRVQ